MEFPVHPALYWQRSRLGEINSRTLEYYPLELESLYERARAYASLGRVETLSLHPEQGDEIREVIPVAGMFGIAMAVNAGNCR